MQANANANAHPRPFHWTPARDALLARVVANHPDLTRRDQADELHRQASQAGHVQPISLGAFATRLVHLGLWDPLPLNFLSARCARPMLTRAEASQALIDWALARAGLSISHSKAS